MENSKLKLSRETLRNLLPDEVRLEHIGDSSIVDLAELHGVSPEFVFLRMLANEVAAAGGQVGVALGHVSHRLAQQAVNID